MAEPAYGGADDSEPAPARRSDPRAAGWAAGQQAVAIAAESVACAARELAGRPDDDAAVEMLRLTIRVLGKLGEAIPAAVEFERDRTFSEAMCEEQYAAGYREGYAACRADRRRMHVAGGG
jgi:hypothetical protein